MTDGVVLAPQFSAPPQPPRGSRQSTPHMTTVNPFDFCFSVRAVTRGHSYIHKKYYGGHSKTKGNTAVSEVKSRAPFL